MSKFFINHPIFSAVGAIIIVIAGLITLFGMPIAQYPKITPPTIMVSAFYPGASATTIAETIGIPIEEQVNGIEGMLYMSSQSSNNGSYSLTVTFEVGTDPDLASLFVQNRVAIAEPQLPEEVKRIGVTTTKMATSMALMITLTSPDNTFDSLFLSNYASLHITNELKRVKGVGNVVIFGLGDYSMRIWLDPAKLKARGLTVQDVILSIEEQNIQIAAGQIGQSPAPKGQSFQYSINAMGRLSDAEQFEKIIIKTSEGRITYLKDIAKIELGSESYDVFAQINGKSTVMIAVNPSPGANALNVATGIREKIKELSKTFPKGLDYQVPFDTSDFIQTSIDDVFMTLLIATILVFVVIFIFLQEVRATIIPAITIPVSLIGTFAVMSALGFSINMLTLFGLILAIGIVVDDAIIVVENASRHILEDGLSAKDATIRAMKEVSGPIYATTFVLLSVFIPTAFIGGVTGQLYKQFALTIAASTCFSALTALTLSPALCALVLKPKVGKKNFFFRGFNSGFSKTGNFYHNIVSSLVRRSTVMMILYFAIAGATLWGFSKIPTGFIPSEDQGYVIACIQLPNAASLERTAEVVSKLNEPIKNTPGVQSWMNIVGYSLFDGSSAPNSATIFIMFENWSKRTSSKLSQDAILANLNGIFYGLQDATGFAFAPPPISGLGVASGFNLMLQDKGNVGLSALQATAYELVADGNAQSGLDGLSTTINNNIPQLFLDIDRVKAKVMGVSLTSIFQTLQSLLGAEYINDFNKFGRTFQVKIQAGKEFRYDEKDIGKLYVRSMSGKMIPLSTLVTVKKVFGPQIITRYNLYPAASINGNAGPGYSSGEAIDLMENMANHKLNESYGYEWTGMAFQEKEAGSATLLIFALAIVFVFLILAALFESFTIPLGVIFSVPIAILGVTLSLIFRGMDDNIYTQIGIVLLIALACKNAILIIEFAKTNHENGKSIIDAACHAAKTRFRPILMTSFAFILGVLPLVIAKGAGASGRQALGTAVFGGMLAATILAIFFIPVFYVFLQKMVEHKKKKKLPEKV